MNSFLQSNQWADFQKSLGRKTWRIQGQLVIRHDLPMGKNYLYCPRGLVNQSFLGEVVKIGQQEKSIFFKIESEEFEIGSLQKSDFKFFVKSSRQLQPNKTIILDIDKPEEELLSQMHQKTRYNIGLAQKKEIKIKESDNIDSFIKLLKQTAERNKFHSHPDEYYQKMLEQDMIKLFIAKYQDQVIAANLVCFFGRTAVYLHGASNYEYRQLMAPYLLQWQIIIEAKKLGIKYYDFWGIDQEKWPGVTRFKKGFGGKEAIYPGTYDLIFQKTWYMVYNLARSYYKYYKVRP